MSLINIPPARTWIEWGVLSALAGLFAVLVLVEGARSEHLAAQLPVEPKAFYETLKTSKVKIQIVDVRESSDDYEDMHLPGAIPFPNCDLEKTAEEVRERIVPSMLTLIVSDDGDPAVFAKCAAHFTSARNLAGGMTAWDDENLPEDSGEYVPPKASAGGGCL
jgi:rhodanese-related sulfurtransferase